MREVGRPSRCRLIRSGVSAVSPARVIETEPWQVGVRPARIGP